MQQYTWEPLTPRLWRIVDALGVAMYLAVGQNRACLVDTGYGLAGLRQVVQQMTDKPVFVLLTHSHVDHAFGIYEFDEIYLNHLDWKTYQLHADPVFRKSFLSHSSAPLDQLTFQPVRAVSFRDVADGQIFDLGGLHLQAVHVPGHTAGMTMVLLMEERMMLFGDACGPNTMLMEDCSAPITRYRNSLLRVKTRYEGRYDRILRNHGTFESSKDLLDNVLEVCERILTRTDAHQLLPPPMQTMFPSRHPSRYLCYSANPWGHPPAGGPEGNINYREDKLPYFTSTRTIGGTT